MVVVHQHDGTSLDYVMRALKAPTQREFKSLPGPLFCVQTEELELSDKDHLSNANKER